MGTWLKREEKPNWINILPFTLGRFAKPSKWHPMAIKYSFCEAYTTEPAKLSASQNACGSKAKVR